ncbi:MAG: hypothetical protein WAW91_03475 [Candidatus Nanoperiomorbaceae bacterium]
MFCTHLIGRIYRMHTTICSIGTIVLLVVLANSVYLWATNPNPLLVSSGVTNAVPLMQLNSTNTIDQNNGFVSQALGVASAKQLIHGKLPIWNSNEGVGAPLAGEMQSGALFVPFNILLLLPGGWLIFHIVLEILAGVGTYLFLRKLKLDNWVAIVGGSLFAMNGTFAWLTNAIFNPIAFLPWMLLGLELIRDESTNKKFGYGWIVLAVALAYSIYAGFPEVAYLDGLLVAVWAAVRIVKLNRVRKKRYAARVILGGLVGVVLALPAIYLFYAYMKTVPEIGIHVNTDGLALGLNVMPHYFFAYVYGLIFDHQQQLTNWGGVGGYITVLFLPVALLGLLYKKIPRSARIALGAVALVGILRMFGFPVVTFLFDKIPLMSSIAISRYISVMIAMAVVILAALGLQYLAHERPSRKIIAIAFGLFTAAVGWLSYIGLSQPDFLSHADQLHWFLALASIIIPLALGWIGFIILLFKKYRIAAYFLGMALIIYSLILFIVPQLMSPPRNTNYNYYNYVADNGAIQYFRTNLGMSRYFATDDKLRPNYSSYYGLASVNTENLPVPSTWNKFVTTKLDHSIPSAITFNDVTKTSYNEFITNLKNYEAIGVKYLTLSSQSPNLTRLNNDHLTAVYRGPIITIVETPNSSAYFSAPGCTIMPVSRNEVKTDCAKPSQLTRQELFFPGWNAEVDGRQINITSGGIDRLFQKISLPAGRHTVTFNYWPSYLTLVLVVSISTLIILVTYIVYETLIISRKFTIISSAKD